MTAFARSSGRRRRRITAALMTAILVGSAAPAAAGSASPAPPPQRFHAVDETLGGLIADLLSANPGLRAARSQAGAGVALIRQSRALPDPQVAWKYYVDAPETRVGPQRHSLEVSQSVPWFGKRALAGRRSEQLAQSLEWQVRDLEVALVARLKRRYFEMAYLHEALAVNAEEQAILERFEHIALTRYATGEGIQQSVIKVQTDITRLQDDRTRLLQQLESVAHDVARLTGRPADLPAWSDIDLRLESLEMNVDRLVEEAIASHPGARAVANRALADETLVERRHLDRRPDFRFGVGYTEVDRREDAAGLALPPEGNGDDILAITVGVSIPLWGKRNAAGLAEAELSLGAQRARLEDVRDRLALGVREGGLRLRSLEERVRLHQEVLIPQAEESLASAEAAYTTDRQSFLDLLDAERIVFQVRLTARRLLADYWLAMTDVEQALGRAFPGPEESRADGSGGGA